MPKKEHVEMVETQSREQVRLRLRQAGVLVLTNQTELEAVSDEELERTGDLRPGALSSEALVRQDRG